MEESLARTYFKQMAEAISYLHSRQICHRDLKPENVLLCSSQDQRVDQTIMKTFCGTKIYMAPEMWNKAGKGLVEVYTLKVDCWALVRYRSTALQRSETRNFNIYFQIFPDLNIFLIMGGRD